MWFGESKVECENYAIGSMENNKLEFEVELKERTKIDVYIDQPNLV